MVEYSDGTIRKRNVHGTWQWQGLIFETCDGKRRQKTKMLGVPCDPLTDDERGSGRRITPTGKGARQAAQKLREWRNELVAAAAENEPKNGLRMAQTSTEKVCDYVQRYWTSRDIEPETLQHYRYLLRHMERAELDVAMSELDTARVRMWVQTLRGEGLGASMLNKCWNQLKYACEWAVENGDLAKNPCLKRDTPKRGHHEPNPMDKANVERMWESLASLRESKPVLAEAAALALTTGMREGEICALMWDDVDDDFIHVRNVITRGKGGGRIKPYPKNGKRRDIPTNDTIRAIFERLHRRSLESVAAEDMPRCYVFANIATPDAPPSPAYLGKQWSMFAAMSGTEGVDGKPPRFHDLRDTFATQALISGEDVVTVASILGHTDITTTLRHYARWMPNANRDAMRRMSDIVGSSV